MAGWSCATPHTAQYPGNASNPPDTHCPFFSNLGGGDTQYLGPRYPFLLWEGKEELSSLMITEGDLQPDCSADQPVA
eukprot:69574-Pelagomonas_calceolata.AAC.1